MTSSELSVIPPQLSPHTAPATQNFHCRGGHTTLSYHDVRVPFDCCARGSSGSYILESVKKSMASGIL